MKRKTIQANVSVHDALEQLRDLYGIKTNSEMIAFLIKAHELKPISALEFIKTVKAAEKLNKQEYVQMIMEG